MWDVLADSGEVMAHDHQCPAFEVPIVYVFPEQCLAEFIEGRVGLIEQQQGRVSQTQTGEQGALQFAAGEGHQRSIFQAVQAPFFEDGFQPLATDLR
ncbi:hypothetical protein D3C84_830470 [compost metagenome]